MTGPIHRRRFLQAAGGGALLAGGLVTRPMRAAQDDGWPELPRTRIHVVYIGLGGAWPKPEFDAPAEVRRFQAHLAETAKRLGDVEFVGGELIPNRDDAAAAVAGKLGDADALLLVHLAFGSGGPLLKLIDAGLPTVIFSQPFSGHDWMYVAQWRRAGKKVVLLPSSDWNDLDRAAALLRVPARLRASRVLLVGAANGTAPSRSIEAVRSRLGTEVIPVSVEEVVRAHGSVDAAAAEAEAESCWLSTAKAIVEPSREEVVKSAAMYLAMRTLMIEHGAQAITIACLGGIPIGVLGYPCLGFAKLCDLGLVGACEADMDSTLTMLAFAHAFGVPGFISDPLFDTAKDAVIHAHCVSPTRMDGPDGKRAPFLLRSHRDDNLGASLEVEMRVGQEITCAKLCNLDTMLLSTGTITEIPDFDDRGCRTQIVTKVADARSMVDSWGSGVLEGENMMTLLHRVVFYGNHVENVRHLADLMGWKVVMEG